MISAKRKIILDKTYIKAIAFDILLGLFVGSVISLLLFLGFYRYKGAADLMEILPLFFVLIFINSPYSYLFRFVILVPIYAPIMHHSCQQKPNPKNNIPEELDISYALYSGSFSHSRGYYNDRWIIRNRIW